MVTMRRPQMLVRGLDGRTLCLRFESASVCGRVVAEAVTARTGIPSGSVRLVTGTAAVREDTVLVCGEDGSFASCSVLVRLAGGKGGFGSLLRGAATKAGQKKTSNFDACRDMSGRRLRHVNAEKKLKEWKADADERALEKTAEEFLKKATKAEEEDNGVFEELEKFRAETSQAMEAVEQAVASGLVAAKKTNSSSKRKVQEEAAMLEKRARLWMGDEDDDEDDSDDESMDEDERPSSSCEAGPSSSGEAGPSSSGEAGPSSSSDADVAVATPEQVVEPTLVPSITSSHVEVVKTVVTETEVDRTVSGVHTLEKVTVMTETLVTVTEEKGASQGVPIEEDVSTIEVVPAANGKSLENGASHGQSLENGAANGQSLENGAAAPEDAARVSNGTEASTSPILKGNKVPEVVQDEPLDFSNYQSVGEMEALGLEKLKVELQSRGLKCGGSLSERAGRLFLLKTVPLEKMEKKHFAGNAKGAKK